MLASRMVGDCAKGLEGGQTLSTRLLLSEKEWGHCLVLSGDELNECRQCIEFHSIEERPKCFKRLDVGSR